MTPRERLLAVLNKEKPDKVPFAPFSELIPRAVCEYEYRRDGMGFIVHHSDVREHNPLPVTVAHRQGIAETTYHTPRGDISETECYMHGASNNNRVKTGYFIKDVHDYAAAIAYIDAITFSIDDSAAGLVHFYLGSEGVTHAWAGEPPYMEAQYYLGLENWSYHQVDYPDLFTELLDALARMQERRMRCLEQSKQDMVCLGNLAGNFSVDAFRMHMLPYFQQYTKRLRDAGIKTTIHADAPNLKAYKDILPLCGADIIEAFTPPPMGDLSLEAARAAWGEDVVFIINYPESVFYEGYEQVFEHTKAMLLSDPCSHKIISLTEMGFAGANSQNAERIHNGVRAVLDAVNQYGAY